MTFDIYFKELKLLKNVNFVKIKYNKIAVRLKIIAFIFFQ